LRTAIIFLFCGFVIQGLAFMLPLLGLRSRRTVLIFPFVGFIGACLAVPGVTRLTRPNPSGLTLSAVPHYLLKGAAIIHAVGRLGGLAFCFLLVADVLGWLVSFVGVCIHLIALARKIPNTSLVRQAAVCSVGLPLSGALLFFIALVLSVGSLFSGGGSTGNEGVVIVLGVLVAGFGILYVAILIQFLQAFGKILGGRLPHKATRMLGRDL